MGKPLHTTPISAAPTNVPIAFALPLPPKEKPILAAAIAGIRKELPAVDCTVPALAAINIPERAENSPVSTNARAIYAPVLIPDNLAAPGLEPTI